VLALAVTADDVELELDPQALRPRPSATTARRARGIGRRMPTIVNNFMGATPEGVSAHRFNAPGVRFA